MAEVSITFFAFPAFQNVPKVYYASRNYLNPREMQKKNKYTESHAQ